MAAGAVAAPLIIPIVQLQTHGAKNHITTHTPVSMQSDTPAVMIFYTLDGSRPAVEQRGSSGSRKYSEPILLPEGRVSVRAVAATSDGRESSTVTKVFLVEVMDSNNELVCAEVPAAPRPPEPRTTGTRSPQSGPRFLKSRLDPPTTWKPSSQRSQSADPDALKQPSSTETTRLLQQTDFLRCVQCLSLRPSDPFARFCAQCGAMVPPLPEQRPPPAEGGQMLRCVFCHSAVPVKTEKCLICDASVQQQLQPQASLRLQDHVVCVCCGSGNPAHISRCLTCESRLQPQQAACVPSAPAADGRKLSCPRCKRINNSDARYCDWCGSKPGHAASCVMCWRCGASGHPYAFYCAACGVFLEAPAPPTFHSDVTSSAATDQVNCSGAARPTASTSHDATWRALPASGPAPSGTSAPPTSDQQTQTVGLYYPSATELHRKQQQRLQVSREQRPLLTNISPGRGYWRKQLDHVCAHLRSYAQNNAPFRALLGEPRLGQVVSAVVQEDLHEVSLTVSFVSPGRDQKQVFPSGVGPAGDAVLPAGRSETLSSVTERTVDSSSLRSDLTAPRKHHKPPVKDGRLLRELGPGRGQIGVVQQLLDQGADPCCCGSDGRHALAVAVVNGHHDVIPVLVQRGADVNQRSGQMKNTALHEAAALGSAGLRCVEVLLSCKAGPRWRNAAGQTPYDVAASSGCSHVMSLLAGCDITN